MLNDSKKIYEHALGLRRKAQAPARTSLRNYYFVITIPSLLLQAFTNALFALRPWLLAFLPQAFPNRKSAICNPKFAILRPSPSNPQLPLKPRF